MEVVVGVLLMLLRVSHGVETYCKGTLDKAQCYGALGGTVVHQLMDNASNINHFTWSHNNKIILRWRDNAFVNNENKNRSFFIHDNGTFIFHDLSRTDSGEYKLIIYDSEGRKSEERSLHLTIQAPVSSVRLVSECLSQGERKVSCSSEGGDSPQYNWTLNGHTLTDAELLENNIIILQQDVSGRLVCSASNHISNVSKEEKISDCGFINCTLTNGTHISQWVFAATKTLCIEPTTAPTTITDTTVGKETGITVSFKPSTNVTSPSQNMTSSSTDDPWYITRDNFPAIVGVLSALLILLVVGVVVICTQKKNRNNKAEEDAAGEELTYADVMIMQRQGCQVQQRVEGEVEYGQVKFTKQPRRTVEPAGDYCVYSEVCRKS